MLTFLGCKSVRNVFIFIMCNVNPERKDAGCSVQRENLQPIVLLLAAYKTSIYCSVKGFVFIVCVRNLVNGTKIQWCMYMGSMNREWEKGRARKILVWNREKTNYKIYKHLWYFSLYYMYFLCISSCHVLRGTVWSCVVEYFIVIILIFKWFFVF